MHIRLPFKSAIVLITKSVAPVISARPGQPAVVVGRWVISHSHFLIVAVQMSLLMYIFACPPYVGGMFRSHSRALASMCIAGAWQRRYHASFDARDADGRVILTEGSGYIGARIIIIRSIHRAPES